MTSHSEREYKWTLAAQRAWYGDECEPTYRLLGASPRSARLAIAHEWLARKSSDAVYVKYEAENLVDYEEYLQGREAKRQSA